MCQARVSNKSVLQECFRVLRESVFQSVPQECRARVPGHSVSQESPINVSHKSVAQECLTKVCHKSVMQECHTRLSEKSVKQECSARMAFNAIEHLLFAFYCSVGTLLIRELLQNAFGFVASIRLLFAIVVSFWEIRCCSIFVIILSVFFYFFVLLYRRVHHICNIQNKICMQYIYIHIYMFMYIYMQYMCLW